MSGNQDYQQDLASIRNMMERSVKFISLSGLAGVMAGLYALAGAALAYYFIQHEEASQTLDQYENSGLAIKLALVALAVLILSLVTGLILSYQKALKAKAPFWNETTKRLFVNLMIPLATGGIFIVVLVYRGNYEVVAPGLLLFYGLALVNASSNLFDEFRYLGYAEITLGLMASIFPGYGLYFWSFGFGVLHIFYGALMHRRYDRA